GAIGAAAANVPRQRLVNIGVGGRRYLREQRGGSHDLAGLAVAALNDLQVEPGLLNPLAGGGGADSSSLRDGENFLCLPVGPHENFGGLKASRTRFRTLLGHWQRAALKSFPYFPQKFAASRDATRLANL